jgi:hypothetical protein
VREIIAAFHKKMEEKNVWRTVLMANVQSKEVIAGYSRFKQMTGKKAFVFRICLLHQNFFVDRG